MADDVLDFDPGQQSMEDNSSSAEAQEQDFSSQESVEQERLSPSPDLGQSTPPQDGTKGLLGGLDPRFPPSESSWPKIYNAFKSAQGRLAQMQRMQQAGGSASSADKEQLAAFNQFMNLPGMLDIVDGYVNGNRSMLEQGIASLVGKTPGQAASPQGEQDEWVNLTPQNFKNVLRQTIQSEIANSLRGAVGPIQQQVHGLRSESEMATLAAKYPDLLQYKDAIAGILQASPGLSRERAYLLAKAEAGGFARTRPNPRAAFSEGASPSAGSGEPDMDEEMKRAIRGSGPVYSPL